MEGIASAMEEALRDDAMDDALREALVAHGVGGLCEGLVKMGVRSAEDIGYLSDSDLHTALDVSLVQVRKVQTAANPSNPEMQTEAHCSNGRLIRDDMTSSSSKIMKKTRTESISTEADFESTLSWGPRDVLDNLHRSKVQTQVQVSADDKYLSVADPVTDGSRFWEEQRKYRPMRLIFCRHGESEGNVNRGITRVVPDHNLHLTQEGRQQALAAGKKVREICKDETIKFIVSPYVRTEETLAGILRSFEGCNYDVVEDVRIREQEHGNYDVQDMNKLFEHASKFGPFYFRFPHGESPADCYDRASLWVESTYRRWERNRARNEVIVGHGIMTLVMIMRLLRIPIIEYNNLDFLGNGELVVLERTADNPKYQISYLWPHAKEKEVGGLRRGNKIRYDPIWDGNPDAPMLVSTPVRKTK